MKEGEPAPVPPVVGQCSRCGAPATTENPLLECTRCGMVAYCCKECQKEAYKEHKAFCRQTITTEDGDPSSNDKSTTTAALNRILFSRCFGGAVSLLMHQHVHVHGKTGLLRAQCSHRLVDYFGRRRDEDKRSIRLAFVEEATPAFLDLQERAAAQHGDEQTSLNFLERTLECRRYAAEQISQSLDNRDIANAVAIVAVEQPPDENHGLMHTYLFISYAGPEQDCHAHFQHWQQERQQPQVADDALVLDWDWKTSSSMENSSSNEEEQRGWQLQSLCHNSIDPEFYRRCSLGWQKKKQWDKQHPKEAIRQPWPGGDMFPPLALLLDESNLASTHKEQDAAAAAQKNPFAVDIQF